jgi:hypothetical protein
METPITKFEMSFNLSIKFEGAHEVGEQIHQGLQQSLGGLMNTQAKVLALREQPSKVVDAKDTARPLVAPNGQSSPLRADGGVKKPKEHRQRRARAESPTALLREMKTEGFFSQARSVSEIQEKLKLKAHTVKLNILTARLADLIKKKELFRNNGVEESSYVYKDTPFDEAPRSSSPAGEPVQ